MRVRGYAPGTPCWAELVSPDVAAAERFYGALFGWGRNADGHFTLGGRAAAGLREGRAGSSGAWLISVSTDDPAAAAATVERSGGAVRVAPASVRDLGTTAVFSDAGGALFGIWLRSRFVGAQVSYEPGAICWYELATHDLDRTGAFYKEVFGWHTVEADSEGQPYFEFHHHHDTVGGLVPIDERFPPGVPDHWTVAFMVEDITAACERATELGGSVARGPQPASAGYYARLADPTGGHFAVIEFTEDWAL
ncbi:VOC family protein [Dactylosporangium vinaceum]|uniref:VOC family protein n=1 Tax=Dactylosporangium vinaceum TaxID=53362 RepID=A0ABV5MM08_9ACTN|nr:VOC family protein [Dactylosporangium vinaceum]UAB96807.1 VOC family protein [Dactylosporangium vinaceum]